MLVPNLQQSRKCLITRRNPKSAARLEGAPRRHRAQRRQPSLRWSQADVRGPFSGSAPHAAARRVYGCAGAWKICAFAPSSTMLPAYITATRSATCDTTARSWEIKSMASPNLARSCASRSSICAWIVTSSAVVGSSAISNCPAAVHNRHRDHHPLPHPAGKLVRIVPAPAAPARGLQPPPSPAAPVARPPAYYASRAPAPLPQSGRPLRITGFSAVIGS